MTLNKLKNDIQEEIKSLERIDKAIASILESDRKLKEIDAKIKEKKRLLKECNVINLGDVALLPLIW